jgi:hypothetical protein
MLKDDGNEFYHHLSTIILFWKYGIFTYFCALSRNRAVGDVAQSVEQRTENPCVGGSIPSVTTVRKIIGFYLK